MAIGNDIYRIMYTFLLGTEGEQAVTGFHCRYAGHQDSLPVAAGLLADHAAVSWHTAYDSEKNVFPTSLVLSTAKAYHVVPGQDSDAIGEAVFNGVSSPVWAGSSADSLPWQMGFCATLETDTGLRIAKPRQHRGRMYLPPFQKGLIQGERGWISDGTTGALVAKVAALLEAFNASVDGTQARVVVYSRVGGFTTDVTAVSGNNQVDVQRRRANKGPGGVRQRSAPLDA